MAASFIAAIGTAKSALSNIIRIFFAYPPFFGTQNVVYWDQNGTSVVENNDLAIGDNLNGHATHTVVMLTAVNVAHSRILYAMLNTTVMLAYANLHDTYKH